jgi:hypothetical protein
MWLRIHIGAHISKKMPLAFSLLCQVWLEEKTLRAALYPEARPICCVRGLKSSLVIGQKAEICPTLLHLEAGSFRGIIFLIKKMRGLTWPELVELGAPKMEGRFLASGSMLDFNKLFKIKYGFFQRTRVVGLCGNLNSSMRDYARSIGLC